MKRNATVGFHIVMRLENDWPIARAMDTLRCAARLLVKHGDKCGLFAYRVADTHIHVLLLCDRRTAGSFAHAAESALRQTLHLPVPFEPARILPITSLRHLANALRYVLRQEQHHDTCFDPSHEGSSVQDLLGMRILPNDRSAQRVNKMLPRLTRAEVLSWIGAESLDSIAPDPRLAPDAALATVGLSSFVGRSFQHIVARRLLVHQWQHLSALREVLPDWGARAVRHLRSSTVDPRLAKAMVMQLRYRTWVAAGSDTPRIAVPQVP